jgi:hypothetical protein
MHHNFALDVLGVAVAATAATSPGWIDHAMAYMPTPTALYALLGSAFLVVKMLDMMGLLPHFGSKRKSKD